MTTTTDPTTEPAASDPGRAVDDTCPACGGAGEVYTDWHRDPLSGYDYAEHTPRCTLCDGSGVLPVEALACDGCTDEHGHGPGYVLVDDNACTHGLALCEEHRDVCDLCVEDQQDVDLDAWDPWADAS